MPMASNGFDGIVDRFFQFDAGNDCPVRIAAAILEPDKWGRRRVVSGRGVTDEEAASRCFSEAVERQSAVFDEALDVIRALPADLGDEAIEPRSLLLISNRQYLNAPAWNNRVNADHRLPPRLDKNQSIAWIKARSLFAQTIKFVPVAYCFLGYPQAIEEGFPIPDSNGLASGERTADAIERGFLELVERDAVSIWWYGRVRRPILNVDRDKLHLWKPFEEWIKKCGRKFWVLDLTHDLALPVAAAISCDARGCNLSLGFGAARTREEAAESAMGELVQFEVTKSLQTQLHGSPFTSFLSWCMGANLEDYPFILPSDAASGQGAALSTAGTIDFELLRAKDLDVLVVDLAPQNGSTKAVRVVVPGLRSIWPRFAPGRLYNVPYQLGWHERRLDEAELNPVPILY